MLKRVPVPSVEGGNFSKTNNNMSFRYSSSSLGRTTDGKLTSTNLKESLLRWQMTAKDGNVLIPCGLTADTSGSPTTVPPWVLVENIQVRMNGYSSSINNPHISMTNLDWYVRSRENQRQMMDYGYTPDRNYGYFYADEDDISDVKVYALPYTPFFNYSVCKEFDVSVTESSTHLEANLNMPLKRIYNFAQSEDWVFEKSGDIETHLHLRGDNNYVRVLDLPAIDCENATADASGNVQELVIADLEFVTKSDFKKQPCYVGEPVNISYDISGGGSHNSQKVINSMIIDSSGSNPYSLTFSLDSPLSHGSGDVLVNIEVEARVGLASDPNWNIRQADTIMKNRALPKEVSDLVSKPETEITVPALHHNISSVLTVDSGTTLYSATVDIPPYTVAGLIWTVYNNAVIGSLDGASSYEVTINGNRDFNRPIKVGSHINSSRQVHNYRMRKALNNMGYELRKYDAASTYSQIEKANQDFNYSHAVFVAPDIPYVNVHQKLNIRINGRKNFTSKQVYPDFVQPLTLTLSNGTVKAEPMSLTDLQTLRLD